MDTILNIDYTIFYWINQGLSNPFFDFVLKWIRNEFIWGPLYIFIISFFAYNYGKKSYWLILFCFLNSASSDLVSSGLIKKSVKRDRPCRNIEIHNPNVLVRCGSGYSFTSSHATNHFAIATFLFCIMGSRFKRIKWPLFLWAGLIGFAQIYVGVHFPLDVLVGSIIGFLIGKGWGIIFNKYYAERILFSENSQ